MVLFGTIDITVNGKQYYTGDTTDVIMNNFCGGTIVLFLVVGLLVNSNLIIHFRVQRPSWIDKFLFYLSWFRLFYIIADGVIFSYQFLNDQPPTQVLDPKVWINVLATLSVISLTAIITIDVIIVVIQCCNVHFPSWSLLTGSYSKMTKRVSAAVVTFLLIGVIASIVYKYFNGYTLTIPIPQQFVVQSVIAYFPALILGISMLCTFAYTWIRFWRQTGAIHISSTIKREFKLVALLVAFDTVLTASNISLLVTLATFNNRKSQSMIRQGIYIGILSDAMVPLIGSVIVSCYTLLIVKEGMLSRRLISFRQGLDVLLSSLKIP